MLLSFYKEKQGVLVRWITFAILAILLVFGMYRFYYNGPYATTPLEKVPPFWQWLHPKSSWTDVTIPVVEIDIPISPRWAITFGSIFLLLLLSAYFCFWHNRVSDFLIDTESEMRKVSWPTFQEVVSSSIVVIVALVLLGLYLYLVDFGLGVLFRWVFY